MRHLDMPMRLRRMRDNGFSPKSIVDVGAAQGHWARMAAKIWPQATIFGVDPNESNVAELEATKRDVPQFDYRRAFLGPERKQVRYADRSDQTSLLDVADEHTATAEMVPLDELVADHHLAQPELLKLDVQGFELEVLRGAQRTLEGCQAVLAEVSMVRFFQTVPLAADVISFLADHGFAWYDVMGIYRRQSDDALAQMDLMFVRESHPLRSQSELR
jgi:FkbM family methyltransferase